MDSLSSKVKDIDLGQKKGLDDGLKHAKQQELKFQTGTHDHVSTVTSASHAHDMDSYANKLAEGSKKGIKFRLMEDVAKMDNGESSSSQQGRDCDYDGDSDMEVIYDEMEQSLKDNIGVVNEKRHKLEELQEQIDKNPFEESLREMEARCLRDFETAALDEEQFMKQKSKIEWLSAGDSNSAYFHRALKSKINKGRINSIVDSGGTFLQHDEVSDAFVNHYKVFLGSESSSVIVNRLNIFTSRLNSDIADAMVKDVSNEEIKEAMIVMDVLREFTKWSGLVPSVEKSTVFFCNVTRVTKQAILDVMPFVEGHLPVKYLGVPLISSRLTRSDCGVLVDRVERRIADWKNNCLSFAGRLQLIKAVISSMFRNIDGRSILKSILKNSNVTAGSIGDGNPNLVAKDEEKVDHVEPMDFSGV
ncbi:hypothetical protein QVD17_41611 [Tagetes erecta]|uniref:Uncharacterized protein n=1 Tax=Tagetes erecta TaxID=13708 RepID=A0AAD8JPK3_TARER|nr:hypothetical protein QVD17_41611 [Tagetes erecta]